MGLLAAYDHLPSIVAGEQKLPATLVHKLPILDADVCRNICTGLEVM